MFPKEPFRHCHARHFIILGIVATFVFTLFVQPAHADEVSIPPKIKATLSGKEIAIVEKILKLEEEFGSKEEVFKKKRTAVQQELKKAQKAKDEKQIVKLTKEGIELATEFLAAIKEHRKAQRKLEHLWLVEKMDHKKKPKLAKEKSNREKLRKQCKDLADFIEGVGREGAANRLKIYAAQRAKDQKQIEELSQKDQEFVAEIRAAKQKRMKLKWEIRGLLTPQKEKTKLEKLHCDYGNTTCVVLQIGRQLLKSKQELSKAEEAKDPKQVEKLFKEIQEIDKLYRDRMQKCRDLEKELDRLSSLPKEASPKERTELEKIQSDYEDTIYSILAMGLESMDLQLKLAEATRAEETPQIEKLSQKLRAMDTEALPALQKYVKLKRDLWRLSKSKKTTLKTFQEENPEHDVVVCLMSLSTRLRADLHKARKAKDTQQVEKLRKKLRAMSEVIREFDKLYREQEARIMFGGDGDRLLTPKKSLEKKSKPQNKPK